MTPGTYRIVDTTSGRFYFGSAVDLDKRWAQHQYSLKRGKHPNPQLQGIWNADPQRLRFEVVGRMPGIPRGVRLAAEQVLLDLAGVGSNPLCMNVLKIAGSHEGAKRSDVTKRRLAEAARGRKASPEAKAKMRAAKLGRKLSAAHRAKIGARSRGRPGPKHTADQIRRWRKYSTEAVSQLRSLVASSVPLLTAARRVGIARPTARRIISGEAYADA